MEQTPDVTINRHFTYRKLLRFVAPSIAIAVFTSIYGIVDGYFLSNFAGKTAFAAVNFIMPPLMIFASVGWLFGSGGTALVSKTLGEGDREKANRYFSMITEAALLTAFLIVILGEIFLVPLARAMGATDAMMPDAVLYARILIGGMPFFILQNCLSMFLVLGEKQRLGLVLTIFAGISNMVLDGLLVGLFRFGSAGAAAASVTCMAIGGGIPFVYFLLPGCKATIRLKPSFIEWQAVGKAAFNGVSELASNISASVVSIVFNAQLLAYIGEDGVSAYGFVMYVAFLFLAIFFGFGQGIGPLVGFHYGAGNKKELQSLLKKALLLVGIAGVLMLLLSFALNDPLAKLFVGYDESLYSLSRKAFFLYSFSFLICGFGIFVSGFFTALSNGQISAIISLLRCLVFQLAPLFILPLFIEDKVLALFLAPLLSEVLSGILSFAFLFAKNSKYGYIMTKREEEREQDESASPEKGDAL